MLLCPLNIAAAFKTTKFWFFGSILIILFKLPERAVHLL